MKQMQIQMRSFLWIIKGLRTLYQRLRTRAITKMEKYSYHSFRTFKKVLLTCHLVAKVELMAREPEWTWLLIADKHNFPTIKILWKHEIMHQLIIKQTLMRVYKSILVICSWIKRISSMTPWPRRWIRDKVLIWIKERRTTRSTAKKSRLMRRLVQIANEHLLKGKTFCQLMVIRFKTIPKLLILPQFCIKIQTTTVNTHKKSIINLVVAQWPEVTKMMNLMAKRR